MKSSWRVLSTALLLALGTVVLTVPLRAADEPDGAALFKQKCSMCHGADGKGYAAIKTPNFTDPKWQAGITDDQIVETIKNGKKGTPMPPFKDKLKDEEIQALLKQVRSFNSEKK